MNRRRLQILGIFYTAALLSELLATNVHAQISLPQLPVQAPAVPLPGGIDVNQPLGTATRAAQEAVAASQRRIRDLLRANPVTLESGPRGQPVVRSEVVAFNPGDAALASAQAAGFTLVRERTLGGLDTQIVILRAPAGWSTQRALRRLRALDPGGTYDLNHIYLESASTVTSALAPAAGSDPPEAVGIRIGLIDGGVDASQPALLDASVHSHGCEGAFPSAHGTAVASLLAGRSLAFRGAVPGAQLYASDVYCGSTTGGAADAVADALGWLVSERVPVINISLTGPANQVLENVVRLVIARGHLLVAAVGNDGPSAPARYPAAYAGVIGVTAVDAQDRVLLEAARGKQVDFAAPGADMIAAGLGSAFVAVRGTSFAAPLVAGLLARSLAAPNVDERERSITSLIATARDLGSKGVDRTYGNGLVGTQLRVAPAATAIK
jgi:subtilisin family serine protease